MAVPFWREIPYEKLPTIELVCGEPESKREFLIGEGLALEPGACNIDFKVPLNFCPLIIG